MLKLSNTGESYFTFENAASGTTWFFTHQNSAPNRFIIAGAVQDGPEMSLTAGGDLTIQGALFTAGSAPRVVTGFFEQDYPLPTIAEQAQMMQNLRHLPNVGPTPENGPFNITAMTGGMLNDLEKAHLYIASLHRRIEAEQSRNATQETRIARLEAQLGALLTQH
ncbi:hypothetical protein ACOXXX_18305 [Thalassococcus sp. BH17M4-6]|uniref:hypothetical protein n=1 Tax=Thalassococcus sp. BH17M4-6 TaxID=3413148 RepID=UPI003BE6A5A0